MPQKNCHADLFLFDAATKKNVDVATIEKLVSPNMVAVYFRLPASLPRQAAGGARARHEGGSQG